MLPRLTPCNKNSLLNAFTYYCLARHRNLLSNPFNCNCHLSWLSEWLKKKNIVTGNPRCYAPELLKGMPIQDLKSTDFKCEGRILGTHSTFYMFFFHYKAVNLSVWLICFRHIDPSLSMGLYVFMYILSAFYHWFLSRHLKNYSVTIQGGKKKLYWIVCCTFPGAVHINVPHMSVEIKRNLFVMESLQLP